MKVGRYLILAAVVVATSACYRQVIQTGRTPGSTVIDKPWVPLFLWGLVAPTPIDVSTQCRTGIATVLTEMSFVNGLATALTFGIFSPRHVTVTCAAGSGMRPGTEFYVNRNASQLEREQIIARAIEESDRTDRPVVVRF
jgi:hypothetical protein